MTIKRDSVLIIDDDLLNLTTLESILIQSYDVLVEKSGQKAIQIACCNPPPDLILLNMQIQDMDGYEACRKLKAGKQTNEIPVIFIVDMAQIKDETKGFEAGAVDYITKPVNSATVKARVSTHIKLRQAELELRRLNAVALDSNPMTGLPGNNNVAKRIVEAIKNRESVCVISSDLDYFKAFNDNFGFVIGDKALMFTSEVLKDSLSAVKIPDAFLGHTGGDDFVMVVPSAKAQSVADEVSRRFDEGIKVFYSSTEIASNCIESIDRKGVPKLFPLMSISMAGVDLAGQVYSQYAEVNDACAGAKKMAKAIQGSSFFMDRRKKPFPDKD